MQTRFATPTDNANVKTILVAKSVTRVKLGSTHILRAFHANVILLAVWVQHVRRMESAFVEMGLLAKNVIYATRAGTDLHVRNAIAI